MNGLQAPGCSAGLCQVNGGTSRGTNLFHRFEQFDTRNGIILGTVMRVDPSVLNGTVTVDGSLGAPVGFGCTSARLVTGASTSPGPSADKAQLFSYALAGTPLADISTVGYWAFRSSASTGNALIHLSLTVTVTGSSVPTGFATLVYEPYQQVGGAAAIQNDVWQRWDATSSVAGQGLWWTSRLSNGTPGSQANPQPWAAFQTQFSDARVLGYGFNVGSANPNMVVGGDGLVFGAATTDF
jgi:hypothetical protein